jgi:alanine dehydrogenase
VIFGSWPQLLGACESEAGRRTREGDDMGQSVLGIVGRSSKPDEKRVAIHPRHFYRIDNDLRARLVVERGYGERFGIGDDAIAPLVGRMATRDELIASVDIVLMPKPLVSDVRGLRDGQTLWGWPHLVQDLEFTQLAIDKRLTVIAWESMNLWKRDGSFDLHVFHVNNEMAGYCSVLHAMTLIGVTGHYGRPLSAAVLGFGNTARGAVAGLQSLGVRDVTVLTQREVEAVGNPMQNVTLDRMDLDEDDAGRTFINRDQGAGTVPTAEFLAEHDIVVNCVLQDTDRPLMFVTTPELASFRPGTLIVDVSCDAGMGFDFARPTSFADPMFEPSPGVHYYAVDHSPSYLFDSATWSISEAILPHLRTVMDGPESMTGSMTIDRATEVLDGAIRNPKILSFQNRKPEPPYTVQA